MHHPLETSLEKAQRYVVEAETRVERQRELVAELEHEGRDATQARAILHTFEDTLRFMCEDLADLLKRAGLPLH